MSRTAFANVGRGFALLAACLLVCVVAAHAQTTSGAIKGAVVGPDGGALGGARVTVVLKDNDQNPRTATTSASGDYNVGELAPGVYNVKVELAGYKTILAEDIEVLAGDAQELRFTLEPGDPQDIIRISPEPPPPPPVPAD